MQDIAAPQTTRPTKPGERPAALALLTAPLLLLFAVVPYQHWYFKARVSVLAGWAQVVWRDDEWWFCLLVPALTGWLVYRQRRELRSLPLAGSWWGLPLLLAALFLYWAGYKVDTGYPGFVSAQLTLAALVLLIGGARWLRALFFPWLFLAFMWPMFPLEERLAFPLRQMTAAASGFFLNLAGLDVVRVGTALYSAAEPLLGLAQGDLFRLDVEEPCSGIRSLFSLMMVSALYGYLTLRAPWARLALFLSAIPLAMLGNFARMVLLTVAARWFGSDFAVGRNLDGHQEMSFFHTLAGFAVFAVALGGMFALGSLLERLLRRRPRPPAHDAEDAPPAAGSWISRFAPGLAGLALASVCAGLCAATDTSLSLAEPGLHLNLPLRHQFYQAKDIGMTARERNVLDEGVELARFLYTSPQNRQIMVTVIVGGPGKRTIHRPEHCLPGQGWIIERSERLPLRFADGSEAEATLLRLFRDIKEEGRPDRRMRVLNFYWYVGSDGTTNPDYYGHISKGYLDALFKDINHRWSMVSVFVPVSELPTGQEDGLAELPILEETRSFISHLVPALMKSQSSAR